MFSRALVAAILGIAAPTLALAQGGALATPLDGVWKIAEIATTGANAATNATPQPSLIIFARGHYSYVSVNGTQARPTFSPAQDPSKLTDAEKLARFEQWSPFTAQAGTYEVTGTTLTRRPLVAKNVTAMAADVANRQEFKLEGRTLWLITKSAAGQPASETRTKLTRVQ
jgi:hypothetical protein